MPSAIIYLDESGDLGWSFDHPYRHGGSSRHLTISALLVPSEKAQYPKRVIRDLFNERGWATGKEKKWKDMSPAARLDFATKAADLRTKHSEIAYLTMTVKKENVMAHIRLDPNKLYNWMIKMLLLDRMAVFQHVTLIPDPRSIKVESGSSLHDYLQTELWLSKNAATVLKTTPLDSGNCLGLQFADMLAGSIFTHFEDNESIPYNKLNPHTHVGRLFF